MYGYSGKRFPWLLAASAQLDPYDSTPATYAVPPLDMAAGRKTLAEKLEALVQDAYDHVDREAGRRLAAVLDKHRRRLARAGSSAFAKEPLERAPINNPINDTRRLKDTRRINDTRRSGLRVIPANDR